MATKLSDIPPQSLLYSSTKGAIEQIVRVLAKDLGPRGITVNAIRPGPTGTDMFLTGSWSPETIDHITAAQPQKRIAEPAEIAPLVAFLARDEAGWVNGQSINVDNVRS